MSTSLPQSGLCIVRIEPQDQQFMITIRTRLDIEHTGGERIYNTVDLDHAVLVVRDFLIDFTGTPLK